MLTMTYEYKLQPTLRSLDRAWDNIWAKGFGFPRFHNCRECGYRTTRDVAASQETRTRGVSAVGQTVVENVCGLEATGFFL